jgi:flavin-dependent dehydrogenase
LLDSLPPELVRRIDGVRLYAPNLRHVDLYAPGYYFLATDTPQLMRWLAQQAELAGATVCCRAPFQTVNRIQGGFDLGPLGTTRFLIGADGPNSQVARSLALGKNSTFLFGVEHEYAGLSIPEADKLHCFMNRRIAPGYIAWVVPGVNVTQVGLARRMRRGQPSTESVMASLLEKIAPIFDFRDREPASIRAGLIPCGGLVRPVAAQRVLLVGDAAGMVSPVTAGGIHTALKHGLAAGYAVADFLSGRREDPSGWFVRSYPQFRLKRLLRFAFDHFQSDLAFNLLLGTRAMRTAAGIVYFNHKGVFNPQQTGDRPQAEILAIRGQ